MYSSDNPQNLLKDKEPFSIPRPEVLNSMDNTFHPKLTSDPKT